ncbi:MAG TPA: PaaI family thioesterase [Aurantimonas sp.]
MTVQELDAFLESEFPQLGGRDGGFSIVAVKPGLVAMRLLAGDRHLRPGGTVSGPTLFTLADVAAYVAVLAHIGPVAHAVTTNLSINFLRKPEPGPLVGSARILKLGRRLAVVEVAMTNEGHDAGGDDVLAHAVATYSIPPRPAGAEQEKDPVI